MIYHPNHFCDPIEVEVLEVDFLTGSALIEQPVPPDAPINSRPCGQEGLPQIVSVKRRVRALSLYPIPKLLNTDPQDSDEDHPRDRSFDTN
jgi:hypothetical protein